MSKSDPLLIVADALECFWNASIGSARNSQDSTALAIAGSLSEGFAAIAARLRETEKIQPTDVRYMGKAVEEMTHAELVKALVFLLKNQRDDLAQLRSSEDDRLTANEIRSLTRAGR